MFEMDQSRINRFLEVSSHILSGWCPPPQDSPTDQGHGRADGSEDGNPRTRLPERSMSYCTARTYQSTGLALRTGAGWTIRTRKRRSLSTPTTRLTLGKGYCGSAERPTTAPIIVHYSRRALRTLASWPGPWPAAIRPSGTVRPSTQTRDARAYLDTVPALSNVGQPSAAPTLTDRPGADRRRLTPTRSNNTRVVVEHAIAMNKWYKITTRPFWNTPE